LKNNTKHILEINLAMVLISTSGVLGRYIDLPPAVTIGIRAFGAMLLLAVFVKWKRLSFKLKREDIFIILLSGILMGGHWITYFYSLQLSNVVLVGLLSALCFAVRNLLVKSKIKTYNGSVVMWYQVLVVSIVLIPAYFLFEYDFDNVVAQLPYISILALVTTAIGHTLFLFSLKHFSVTTASLMSSMQPIYGIKGSSNSYVS